MECLMGVWRCRRWGGWICLAVGTASEGSSLLPEDENTHTCCAMRKLTMYLILVVIFVCRWIFLTTDIRNTNTWKISINGHELSIEIVFFLVVKSLNYSFIFSFLIGLGVGRWKKKYCWETQSKHYFDIYKNVSHLSRLCFFLEKYFIWETDVGKTKCVGI